MGDIDKTSVERAYARWAPIYDLVFGAVFERGRLEAIAAAEKFCGPQGGRILEVGVGTGISLPDHFGSISSRRWVVRNRLPFNVGPA